MRHAIFIAQQIIIAIIFILNPSVSISVETAHEKVRNNHNATTIGVVGGSSSGTYTKFSEEMAGEFEDMHSEGRIEEPLRLVPIIGKGSILNLYDLLYLKNVTFAYVQEDVATQLAKYDNRLSRFEVARTAGELNNLRYIKLFSEEIRVVVNNGERALRRRNGLLITKPEDLKGAIISIGEKDTGAWFTATTLLRLWAGTDYTPKYLRTSDAVIELNRGNIDALIVVAAEPNSILDGVATNEDIDILELESDRMANNLGIRTTNTKVDWQNREYNTWSVNALLVAWTGWSEDHPRCIGLKSFVKNFKKIVEMEPYLVEPDKYHPKWTEVSSRQLTESVGNILPLNYLDPCTKN